MEIGDRVKYSPAGLEMRGDQRDQRNSKQRYGFIRGETKDKICWSVAWDGLVTPQAISKRFIEAE